jgi:hypothetical protein
MLSSMRVYTKDHQSPVRPLQTLGVGVISFIVRLWAPLGRLAESLHQEWAHYPQYIGMFVVGILAYRNNWLVSFPSNQPQIFVGNAACPGALLSDGLSPAQSAGCAEFPLEPGSSWCRQESGIKMTAFQIRSTG